MLDENDMRKAIETLKKDIKVLKLDKSSLLLSIIMTGAGLVGGGILFGAVFGQLALGTMIGIIACAPVLATRIKMLEDLNNDIKYSTSQIAAYEKEITNLENRRQEVMGVSPKKTTTKTTKKYAYDGTKKQTSKKEPKIEYFDERDFDDYQEGNNHKKK